MLFLPESLSISIQETVRVGVGSILPVPKNVMLPFDELVLLVGSPFKALSLILNFSIPSAKALTSSDLFASRY